MVEFCQVFIFIKVVFMSLKTIILSCKLHIHKGHSTEQVHHGRPNYRHGGHPDGPMSFVHIESSSMIDRGYKKNKLGV